VRSSFIVVSSAYDQSYIGKFSHLPAVERKLPWLPAITYENRCFQKWQIDIRRRTGNRLIETITLQSKVIVYGRGAVELLEQLCVG
jgi:hypothetical protein